MQIKSLAFKTDLIFHRADGEVTDYGDYLVVRTPSNPSFFWGNLIYFAAPPHKSAFNDWTALFRKHFSDLPVHHTTLAWDTHPDGDGHVEAFINDGFVYENDVVMVADKIVKPSKYNSSLRVRAISSESDWQAALQNQIKCRARDLDPTLYKDFAEKRMANRRRLAESGKGFWMGAFLGDELVGDLGIFGEGGLVRFQAVGTSPDHRRIGACTTLVYESCLFAMKKLNALLLVMVADVNYHAAKIYESVGFQAKERQAGLLKYDKGIWH